ncbi:hypothetical protein [Streptomyces triticirhizae]|uniref:Uncharacterized protein n=1 Tax=Streptomyces triticirhizae TaxID=2483353 RepID=A0A3M2M4M7_9ACTN|nr:hypothetical protein [Streptomyces triticirhizae]RMI44422.1 hypothetical protein EBN88_05325 [Streptomyces triticirhizae]
MTRWIEDPALEAPDGHRWVRPAPDDCPACPCHTLRTCEGHQWHLATPPAYGDGAPYTEPCPCEQAATPEPRTITVTLGGTTRTVPVNLHRRGWLLGQLTTADGRDGAVFAADVDGRTVRVRARFEPATDGTPAADRCTDSAGTQWVLARRVSHGAQFGTITGWADPTTEETTR